MVTLITNLNNRAGFTLGCVSYNNQLTLSLVANQEIFDSVQGEKLLGSYFQKEVGDLLNGIGDETRV